MIDGSTEIEAGMVVIMYETRVKCNARDSFRNNR